MTCLRLPGGIQLAHSLAQPSFSNLFVTLMIVMTKTDDDRELHDVTEQMNALRGER